MEHTLLPKILALPIFASDALSSVAYSVEASMVPLVLATNNYRGLIVPINLTVAGVMAVVVLSYRQVVHAYPTSAGSYVVSKENLAPIFGLIAAAALLADYVLTVAVSVSSGVVAVTSISPRTLGPVLVPLSLLLVALLLVANIRGVREAGILFAIPTYGFILSIFTLIAVGAVRCIGGCPHVGAVPDPLRAATPVAAAGMFAILHAFTSGSSALTGTEAISNGVSAFRRPQGRNASQTLGLLGLIAVIMITGTAFLALKTGAHPSNLASVSVVSEIARAVFPGSSASAFMFYVVQGFTFAVLILAANTSFQGFPRLLALLARDRYAPRQFENLGDRLVYSNGMVVLAALAGLLIVVYRANVNNLLQLYVVGVFTAFPLSQIGMVRYWHRASRQGGAKAQGWHWRLSINAVGAVATAIVLVTVIYTKFLYGAYVVITAIPIMIAVFLAIHRHYAAVASRLRRAEVGVREGVSNVVVIYVADLNAAVAEAIGYVRGLRGTEVHAVHIGEDPTGELAERWRAFSRMGCSLEVLPLRGSTVDTVREYLRGFPRGPGRFVTVVVPELLRGRSLAHALRRSAFRLKYGLLGQHWVVVTDVPVLAEDGEEGGRRRKTMIPQYTEVLVFVSAVHDATIRAVNYARSLRADRTRAVFFALDPSAVDPIVRAWEERNIPLELDVVEAPFRELDRPILAEVRSITARPEAVAVVVVPEIVVHGWWQFALHGQRALFIKRLLLFEDRVLLTSVPYQVELGERAEHREPSAATAGEEA